MAHIFPPSMLRNSSAVLPFSAIPAHAPPSPPQARFSQQTRLRAYVHALNRPKHPLAKLVNSECCTIFPRRVLSNFDNPTDRPKKSHFLRARKNAHARPAGDGQRRKNAGCILALPKGGGQNRPGRHDTPKHHDDETEGCPIQAATADVAPAHMVKCAG